MDEAEKLQQELGVVSSVVAAMTACLEEYMHEAENPEGLRDGDIEEIVSPTANQFLSYLGEHDPGDVVGVLFGLLFGTMISYTSVLDIDPFSYLQALGQVAALTQAQVQNLKDQ